MTFDAAPTSAGVTPSVPLNLHRSIEDYDNIKSKLIGGSGTGGTITGPTASPSIIASGATMATNKSNINDLVDVVKRIAGTKSVKIKRFAGETWIAVPGTGFTSERRTQIRDEIVKTTTQNDQLWDIAADTPITFC